MSLFKNLYTKRVKDDELSDRLLIHDIWNNYDKRVVEEGKNQTIK